MTGEEFHTWLGETAETHKELMTGAGFLATN
jgi:hypothetical protein